MNISFKKYALSMVALVACAQSTGITANPTIASKVPDFMEALAQATPNKATIAACLAAPALAGLAEMAKSFSRQAEYQAMNATSKKEKAEAAVSSRQWSKVSAVINAGIPTALAVSSAALFYTLFRFFAADRAIHLDMSIAREAANQASASSNAVGFWNRFAPKFTWGQTISN